MTQPKAEARIQLRVEKRLLRKELRGANRRIREFSRTAKRNLQAIGTGIKLGIGGALAMAGKSALDLNKEVWHLGRQAGWSNAQIDQLPQKFRDIAAATGVQAEQVYRLAQRYMDLTGDIGSSIENAEYLAKAVAAQNAPAGALAGLMWTMTKNLGLTNKEARTLLNTFIAIGDQGSVPLERMAQTLPEMVAVVQGLSTEAKQEAGKLSAALLQVLEGATNSPEKSITATKAALASLGAKAKNLRKIGIKVFDAEGNRRGFIEILDQFRKAGDLSKNNQLRDLLGSDDAVIAVQHLVKNLDQLKQLSGVSADGLIDKNFAKLAESSAGKMAMATERARNALAESFTPEVIEKIADATVFLADGVELLADNLVPVGIGFAAIKGISLAKLLRDLRFTRAATKALGIEAKKTQSTMTLFGGIRGAKGGVEKTTRGLSRVKGLVGGLGAAVPVVGAAFAAWEIGGLVKDLISANDEIHKFKRHVAGEDDPAGLVAEEANKALDAAEKLQQVRRDLKGARFHAGIAGSADSQARVDALEARKAQLEENQAEHWRRAAIRDRAVRATKGEYQWAKGATDWERVKPVFLGQLKAELATLTPETRTNRYGKRTDDQILREHWQAIELVARKQGTAFGDELRQRELDAARAVFERQHKARSADAPVARSPQAPRASKGKRREEIHHHHIEIVNMVDGLVVSRRKQNIKSRSPR